MRKTPKLRRNSKELLTISQRDLVNQLRSKYGLLFDDAIYVASEWVPLLQRDEPIDPIPPSEPIDPISEPEPQEQFTEGEEVGRLERDVTEEPEEVENIEKSDAEDAVTGDPDPDADIGRRSPADPPDDEDDEEDEEEDDDDDDDEGEDPAKPPSVRPPLPIPIPPIPIPPEEPDQDNPENPTGLKGIDAPDGPTNPVPPNKPSTWFPYDLNTSEPPDLTDYPESFKDNEFVKEFWSDGHVQNFITFDGKDTIYCIADPTEYDSYFDDDVDNTYGGSIQLQTLDGLDGGVTQIKMWMLCYWDDTIVSNYPRIRFYLYDSTGGFVGFQLRSNYSYLYEDGSEVASNSGWRFPEKKWFWVRYYLLNLDDATPDHWVSYSAETEYNSVETFNDSEMTWTVIHTRAIPNISIDQNTLDRMYWSMNAASSGHDGFYVAHVNVEVS